MTSLLSVGLSNFSKDYLKARDLTVLK